MKAKEILEKKGNKVFKINEKKSAEEAVNELRKNHIGSLLVLDEDEQLTGIISERDILYKCHERGGDHKKTPVKELYTPLDKIIIGTPDDTTTYLMRVMTEKKIRHIPILEKEKIVGIISIGDVIKTMLEESEAEAHLLREFVQNPYGITIV